MQGTYEDPMDVDAVDFNEALFNELARPPLPPPSSNTMTGRRRIKHTIYLSDGESVEYSSEEDVPQHSPQPPPRPSQNRFASSSHVYGITPGPSTVDHIPPTQNSVSNQQKRPRRGYRKYEFGDGEVFYLTTDDENVDERPRDSPEKKPRLGGALIKSRNGISSLAKPALASQTPQPSPSSADWESFPVISQWSSLSNWNSHDVADLNNPFRSDPTSFNAPYTPGLGGLQNTSLAGSSTPGINSMHPYQNCGTLVEHKLYGSNTSDMRIPGSFPMPQQIPQPGYGMPNLPNMGYHASPASVNIGQPTPNGVPIPFNSKYLEVPLVNVVRNV